MEEFNPIKLDSKNGLVRIIKYGDQLFNYGAFPQTWESPQLWTHDPVTGGRTRGDNDPIDVVEIGGKQQKSGSIIKVKVLGVLGLIDAGETDWKVFAIAVDDPMASRIHTLEDMKAHMPGALEAERDYLRFYKEDINTFIFGGEVKDEVRWAVCVCAGGQRCATGPALSTPPPLTHPFTAPPPCAPAALPARLAGYALAPSPWPTLAAPTLASPRSSTASRARAGPLSTPRPEPRATGRRRPARWARCRSLCWTRAAWRRPPPPPPPLPPAAWRRACWSTLSAPLAARTWCSSWSTRARA
jgi:inorganic pyrophosphatase